MATSVTLRQEKTILTGGPSDLYRVVSTITVADPEGMYPLFKVSQGIAAYAELYLGVVALVDLTKYAENKLLALESAVGTFSAIGTVPGDTLEITNAASAVPEWFDTFFTAAIFTIDSVSPDGSTVFIDSDLQPFPTAAPGLAWEVRPPVGAPRGNGTAAWTRRNSTAGSTTYLRRHWTSVLDSVAAGESRATSIKALVESLVDAAKIHDISFAGVETKVYE